MKSFPSIEFTKNCEKAIKTNHLNGFLRDLKEQLNSYTSVDLNDDEFSTVLELKLKALILDTIHYIQVVEDLIGKADSLKSDRGDTLTNSITIFNHLVVQKRFLNTQ